MELEDASRSDRTVSKTNEENIELVTLNSAPVKRLLHKCTLNSAHVKRLLHKCTLNSAFFMIKAISKFKKNPKN